ncbi:Protein kinase-like domain protein [Cordyceps fumosorosea ARSEF 2679]|uniref:Protein kinase-like domain protein n=1 Tax=Cordyceps fumosorosea (strain ARSEF 2679) TaxID=1081104 RepID=A0A167VTZ7_CORFA|nr:Protein kinase-like domain protein [Cordyceps fumosorosea ARSEF 2679]OAA62978.1 Protein kinase-like domain protein [Cordyceps fumosorosea ARSEF 2679]
MASQYFVYSLNDSIESFFHDFTDATRQECDHLAQRLVGPPLEPVPIQGHFSYTVAAGDPENRKIVQFRAGVSKLDMDTMRLAKQAHPRLVPTCTEHGTIGLSRPLSVYEMDIVRGSTCTTTRELDPRKTVGSLAGYFAESWIKRQPMHSPGDVQREYAENLRLLRASLPARFSKVVGQAHSQLWMLFSPSYPSALVHDDLTGLNMLVGDDGRITGVVDWADARVLPFGKSLYALENALGSMGPKGWHYSDDRVVLEALFWQTFHRAIGDATQEEKDAIQASREIGILFQYGFIWEEGVRRPTREGDSTMRYLDAFLTDG